MLNHSLRIRKLAICAAMAIAFALPSATSGMFGASGSAWAQSEETVVRAPREKPSPEELVSEPEAPVENLLDRPPEPLFSDALLPYAPATQGANGFPTDATEGVLYLMARLTRDTDPLTSGLIWRIYSETTNSDGKLELVAKSEGGHGEFRLDPGVYLIHTGYGYATAVNRIVMGRKVESKMVILNAGGVKLNAALDQETPLKANVKFDVYDMEFNERGERRLIVGDIPPETIVRLNADTYHIVSRYGDTNSVVRADVQVLPGKLTEAMLYHDAAEITLKLVNEGGGEAIANTSWSVLSPGGDVVVEATGAFPSFVLATGDYEVIARNNGRLFRDTFEVKNGDDREVEVLASSRSDKAAPAKVN